MRGCQKTLKFINVNKATDEDFDTEYNDYIVAIKVVKDIDEAIEHINTHSTKHSEAIITKNKEKAFKFMALVDSACVYHNASTRFTDGGCFGFGAEIGISTQKLHARGPMGLKEIMSYRYKIYGNGEVRS
jgi:glutamate-5-semialdehyde dehydrogenase